MSTRAQRDGLRRDPERVCQWCGAPIRPGSRSDAKFDRTRCRQAAHRFRRAGVTARVANGHPLRLAYADPPYPGMARRYYQGHPDYAGEVDHADLIRRLSTFDGWALSTSAAALPTVLPLCPPGVRVAAWFRGERPTRSFRPLVGWEPVIFWGGRAYMSTIGQRRVDALVHVARARTTDPRRVIGSKPAAFCFWLFDLLGALPGDELADLFPGSGGIGRAWTVYTSSGSEQQIREASS